MKTAPMSEKPAEEVGEMNDSVEVSPAQTEGMPADMEGSPEGGEVPAETEGASEGGEMPAGTEGASEGEQGGSEDTGALQEDVEAGSGVLDKFGGQ
jgi:hypothetical protein